jgi:hypothetical protein
MARAVSPYDPPVLRGFLDLMFASRVVSSNSRPVVLRRRSVVSRLVDRLLYHERLFLSVFAVNRLSTGALPIQCLLWPSL